jgi:hypothetical protein
MAFLAACARKPDLLKPFCLAGWLLDVALGRKQDSDDEASAKVYGVDTINRLLDRDQ